MDIGDFDIEKTRQEMEYWNDDKKAEFEKLKKEIKAILISSLRQEITAADLNENYIDLMRKSIDYLRFGFKTLDQMLCCMPDVVQYNVDPFTKRVTVIAVSDVRTRHLENLVEGQRNGAPSRFGGIVSKSVIRNKLREGMARVLRRYGKMELEKMIDTFTKWQGESIHGMARRCFNSSFSEALKNPSLSNHFKVTEESGKEMIEIVTRAPMKYVLPHTYKGKRVQNVGPRLQKSKETEFGPKVYDRETFEALRLQSSERKVFVNGSPSGSITVELENLKMVESPRRATVKEEDDQDTYEQDRAKICLQTDVDADQFIECCIQLIQTSFLNGISIGDLMAEIEKYTGLAINWRDDGIRQALTALGAQLGRFDVNGRFMFHPPPIETIREKEVAEGLLIDLSSDDVQEDSNKTKDSGTDLNGSQVQIPSQGLPSPVPSPSSSAEVDAPLTQKQVELMIIFRCVSELGASAKFQDVHEKLGSLYELSLPAEVLETIFKEMTNWFKLSYLSSGELCVCINFGRFSQNEDLPDRTEDSKRSRGPFEGSRIARNCMPG